MTTPFTRAPHQGSAAPVPAPALNAALLIDFDNVTMGMRSDLSKDLQKLLQSDIIKGKVTVQRAYADWRRYPQYIVPLSENSIDLIFAPAYGSSKKNATDIRMAIDGMELVFTRPEIGTFILLTGDSDFSSLVLKLKEYGKYVIGVGIQESSSDILVQNCDEYYSYTSITGLTKTSETDLKPSDPWELTQRAVKKMVDRGDVMRSDRLKQVMVELDSTFDEGNFGFSKFSRFITEAASKKLVKLKKLENGQYEVAPMTGGGRGSRSDDDRGDRSERRGRRGRGGRGESGRDGGNGRQDRSRKEKPAASASGDPLQDAYGLLREALQRLSDDGRDVVRDSDVKRKMLEIRRGFDEAELGFGKFSRFLRQAHDHEVIDLRKRETGNYEVSLAKGAAQGPGRAQAAGAQAPSVAEEEPTVSGDVAPLGQEEASPQEPDTQKVDAPAATGGQQAMQELFIEADRSEDHRRLGPRRGSTRRRGDDDPPPLFAGQVAGVASSSSSPTPSGAADTSPQRGGGPNPGSGPLDLTSLGLPTDDAAAIRYLSNSWKGVGARTAEALIEHFGTGVFDVLHTKPERIQEAVPAGRAEAVVEAWREDYERRSRRGSGGGPAGDA